MRFAPVPPVTMPLALETIDDRLGTNTQEAYAAAVASAPHLGGIAIILDDSKATHFHPSKLGLGGSYVSLNPTREYHIDAIRSGIATTRLHEIGTVLRAKGYQPSIKELAVVYFLHELGHVDELKKLIDGAAGDTEQAFATAQQARDEQIATLPLGMITSRALRVWETNQDGYQDAARTGGVTDSSWQDLITANLQAYSALPCERVADEFALGILSTLLPAA